MFSSLSAFTVKRFLINNCARGNMKYDRISRLSLRNRQLFVFAFVFNLIFIHKIIYTPEPKGPYSLLRSDTYFSKWFIIYTKSVPKFTCWKGGEFVDWTIELHELNTDFSSKIILSDEAHFHLHGFINCQNCHIWDSENPHVTVGEQLHP